MTPRGARPRLLHARPVGFLASVWPGRYALVVLALLGYVLIGPFTGVGTAANRLLNILIVATLLGVVGMVWPKRRVLVVAIVLATASLLPTLGIWPDESGAGVTSHIASMLFDLLIIAAILSHVLTTEYVTLDTVIGAASVYVMIGILWATLYALLEYWRPGSFNLPPTFQTTAPSALTPLMRDMIVLYYSFETLTTVAYGDVTPATPPARFLSVAEALVGQLYLAVLVARFVGLQVTHHASRRTGGGSPEQ